MLVSTPHLNNLIRTACLRVEHHVSQILDQTDPRIVGEHRLDVAATLIARNPGLIQLAIDRDQDDLVDLLREKLMKLRLDDALLFRPSPSRQEYTSLLIEVLHDNKADAMQRRSIEEEWTRGTVDWRRREYYSMSERLDEIKAERTAERSVREVVG